jgi:hypothetical protein
VALRPRLTTGLPLSGRVSALSDHIRIRGARDRQQPNRLKTIWRTRPRGRASFEELRLEGTIERLAGHFDIPRSIRGPTFPRAWVPLFLPPFHLQCKPLARDEILRTEGSRLGSGVERRALRHPRAEKVLHVLVKTRHEVSHLPRAPRLGEAGTRFTVNGWDWLSVAVGQAARSTMASTRSQGVSWLATLFLLIGLWARLGLLVFGVAAELSLAGLLFLPASIGLLPTPGPAPWAPLLAFCHWSAAARHRAPSKSDLKGEQFRSSSALREAAERSLSRSVDDAEVAEN